MKLWAVDQYIDAIREKDAKDCIKQLVWELQWGHVKVTPIFTERSSAIAFMLIRAAKRVSECNAELKKARARLSSLGKKFGQAEQIRSAHE